MTVDILTMHVIKSMLKKELGVIASGEFELVASAVNRVLSDETFIVQLHMKTLMEG